MKSILTCILQNLKSEVFSTSLTHLPKSSPSLCFSTFLSTSVLIDVHNIIIDTYLMHSSSGLIVSGLQALLRKKVFSNIFVSSIVSPSKTIARVCKIASHSGFRGKMVNKDGRHSSICCRSKHESTFDERLSLIFRG